MRTFLLKVGTTMDFVNEFEFAGRLEDLVPWIYNPQTKMPEERHFKKVTVVPMNPGELHALGER